MLKISGQRVNFIIHFLLLVGLFLIFCLPYFFGQIFPPSYWLRVFVSYVIYVSLYFFNIRVLVPRFLFKNRSGWFVLALYLILTMIVFLNHWGNSIFGELPRFAEPVHSKTYSTYSQYVADLGSLLIIGTIIGLGTIITVAQKITSDVFEKKELEKEKISTELSFLKAQINPHFYFNVQHSIYALTATDIEAAREAIYTLSHMMRYVLYDTKHNRTTLFKEIDFVESYTKLMKLRLTKNVQIIIDKPQNLRDVEVAPMLFLPFIENAFKHGISSIHPSYIYLGIDQQIDNLHIEVRNSLFEDSGEIKEESNGIGLANTKRRLDILYPGKYALEVNKDVLKKEFHVDLKLNLK